MFDRFSIFLEEPHPNHYRPDTLIEILHKAQEAFGYLEQDVLSYIAQGLELPLSHVYGVATFYNIFSLKPFGSHVCSVCMGTACYLKGGSALPETLDREVKLHLGETTSHSQISLTTRRCMGACSMAPLVMFDGKVSSQQTPESVLEKLKGFAEGGYSDSNGTKKSINI